MESQPQNPDFRNNPENVNQCKQNKTPVSKWLGKSKVLTGLNQLFHDFIRGYKCTYNLYRVLKELLHAKLMHLVNKRPISKRQFF